MKNTRFCEPLTQALLLMAAFTLGALGQFFLIQQTVPWTVWSGLALYVGAISLFLCGVKTSGKEQLPSPHLTVKQEFLILILIFLTALFFRFFKLGEFPSGIFPDDACAAYGALRVLHEGWRPFQEIFLLHAAVPSIYYDLALWFSFFSPTQIHLFGYSIFLSLLTLGFLYLAFRRLAGTPTALLAVYILAVMRWDITFSRNAHLCIEVPFYLSATLCFWLYALSTGKRWAYVICAVFFTAGFYSYTSYYAFIPLMMIYALYEWNQTRQKPRDFPSNLALFFSLFLLLSLPLLFHIIFSADHGNLLGASQDRLNSFLASLAHGDFSLLPPHLAGTALMFNRTGDSWYLDNLPYHRMVDDVTGVLWILGLSLAVVRFKQRKYFYALTGFIVMCLPTLLSNYPAQSGRALGAAPFLALLGAFGLGGALETAGKIKRLKLFLPILLAAALGLMAFENYQTYFNQQALDPDCWRDPATDATLAGKRIAQSGSSDEVYVSSRFFLHYAVLFLGYPQKEHVHELRIPEDLVMLPRPADRGLLFVLDEGKTGVLGLLQSLFPGGETEKVRDLQGEPFVYFYHVNAKDAAQGQLRAKNFLSQSFGLKGSYYLSMEEKGPADLVKKDPVLNFTFRNDFPMIQFPPLTVDWIGKLIVPETGSYHFVFLATNSSTLKIDGKKILARENVESNGLTLAKGPHRLEVLFQKVVYTSKEEGQAAALSLLWKKPGDARFDVVPYTAFMQ